jgi:hypothetical protein
MEDDLNVFKNGRRPQFFQRWKTTLIFFKNGRQPQFFQKWKMTSTFDQMEDDL